jgi:murein L,D-transpeptidase YafK
MGKSDGLMEPIVAVRLVAIPTAARFLTARLAAPTLQGKESMKAAEPTFSAQRYVSAAIAVGALAFLLVPGRSHAQQALQQVLLTNVLPLDAGSVKKSDTDAVKKPDADGARKTGAGVVTKKAAVATPKLLGEPVVLPDAVQQATASAEAPETVPAKSTVTAAEATKLLGEAVVVPDSVAAAPKLLGEPVAPKLLGEPVVVPGAVSATKGAVKASSSLFSDMQQDHDRVLLARIEKKFELKKLFRDQGISYPAAELFLRIFKRERELEVWVRENNKPAFQLLKTYPICAMAGMLGPKRAEGDGQTPEGFYFIDGFNPSSDFHLSLHLDYPNRSDQILNKGAALGGNIFIHGGCRTEGCLAVTDDAIKELYWLSVEARSVGQKRIPVHIFPARLTDDELFRLTEVFDEKPDFKRFWANLKPTYDYFESKHELPLLNIDQKGYYRIVQPAALAGDSVRAVVKPGGSN